MKDPQTGCMICGEELVYDQGTEAHQCYFCGKEKESNVTCPDKHFVCDQCHQSSAVDIIEKFCLGTDWTDPIRIANHLMDNQKISMHGPEHHFLVPAVLLSAYYNILGKNGLKRKKIYIAKQRSSQVPGGFCGSHGNCGAAVGSGIFTSVVTGATPLAIKEWQLSNLVTANSLRSIALSGGPRCCKRDSFIAIKEAMAFTAEHLEVEMITDDRLICRFSQFNRQCTGKSCEFHTLYQERSG